MRKVAIALLFAASAASATGFEKTYDRFSGKTTYEHKIELSSDLPIINWSMDLVTTGTAPARAKDTASLYVVITYDLATVQGLDCVRGVESLVDNVPMKFEAPLGPIFAGNYATVTYRHDFSFADAKEFANSKVVEYRICGTEFQLTDEHVSGIRDFLEYAANPETIEHGAP